MPRHQIGKTDLSGYVPYTGATADVDLGTHSLILGAASMSGDEGGIITIPTGDALVISSIFVMDSRAGGNQSIVGADGLGNDGGSVGISGGWASDGNYDGGDVSIFAGGGNGSGSNGRILFSDVESSYYAAIDCTLIQSADRTFTFPDKDGTFAMTNDTDTFLKLDQTTPQTIINGVPLLEATHGDFTDQHSFIDKEYVDQATAAIGERFFMLDAADGTVAAYKQTSITASDLGTATVAVSANAAADTLIEEWISPAGMDWTSLSTGVYTLRVWAERTSGGRDVQLFWRFYERKTDTSEVMIAESNISGLITTKVLKNVYATLSSIYTPDVGSRLVGKVYMRTSATPANDTECTLYYQGTEDSNWQIPVSQEFLTDNFWTTTIAQTGITGNKSGSFDIVTTGNITADNLNISNWNTAFGWGNHAGLYDALGAAAAVTPTTLGLVIGTDVQAYNSNLTGINQALDTTASPTFVNLLLSGANIGIAADPDLLSLAANALTVNGNITAIADVATIRISDNVTRTPTLELYRGTGAFGSDIYADWRISNIAGALTFYVAGTLVGTLNDNALTIDHMGALTVSRDITANADADGTHTFGRAKIGSFVASDYAGFAHFDQASVSSYAFLQHATGQAYVNAPTGQIISLRINNSEQANISITGFNPVSASGKNLGTTALEWGNLYIGTGRVYVGATQAGYMYDDGSYCYFGRV